MEPEIWHRDRCTIQAWHAQGFDYQGIDVPLQVLHTEETEIMRQRIAGQWIEKQETHSWWWATTIPARQLPTRPLWQAAHRRWDVENSNFNTLSRDWALDHCFKHDPTAIINFILTLFIAFVLVQSFYYRNLKSQQRAIFSTLISIAAELHGSLTGGGLQIPWHRRPTHPPP